MGTLNISLPDEMKSWVDDEVRKGGFDDASEFFRQLVREAKARHQNREERQNEFTALMIEGIESGEAQPLNSDWWGRVFARAENRLQAEGKSLVEGENS